MSRRGMYIAGLGVAVIVPVVAAAFSPLLQYRSPIYIGAGFAGILAMSALLIQPFAIDHKRLGIPLRRGRLLHRIVGAAVVALVMAHVAGLWITSPPDVVDALTFRSPTPFSIWGVLAMWAVFGSAVLGLLRLRGRIRWRMFRLLHLACVAVIVGGTILHVILIDGTMEPVTKYAICVALAVASIWGVRRIG